MKLFIIIISFFILSVDLFSYSSVDEFKKANTAFNAGEYEQAAIIYKELLDSGYVESEVYYNLGNSYFRLNKIPQAIINFERAKRLSPNDDDIDFNLQLANLKIVDKFEAVPKLFFIEWYEEILHLYYSGTWGIVLIASTWVLFISILVIFVSNFQPIKRILLFLTVISLITILISAFLAYKSYENENSKNKAIIFNESVYVKSAPDPGSTDLFILHEGTKIELMENIDDWIQIRLENGNIGWIKKNVIEII
jgi:tetratricopeptide (TPR) repeat protein